MNDGALRILIVDDEAPARARLKDLLADCSDDMALEIVGEASTARDAVDILAATPADVVLLEQERTHWLLAHMHALPKGPSSIHRLLVRASAHFPTHVVGVTRVQCPVDAHCAISMFLHVSEHPIFPGSCCSIHRHPPLSASHPVASVASSHDVKQVPAPAEPAGGQ